MDGNMGEEIKEGSKEGQWGSKVDQRGFKGGSRVIQRWIKSDSKVNQISTPCMIRVFCLARARLALPGGGAAHRALRPGRTWAEIRFFPGRILKLIPMAIFVV
jgi:hypothetical protein